MKPALGGLVIVLAVGGCERPSSDPAILAAIASEAAALQMAYPAPTDGVVDVPRSRWPRTIASLKPESLQLRRESVEITTRSDFDGGWGYGVARRREDLTMLPECWRQVAEHVFWHGPC